MPKNEDGEFELILGNRQLFAMFFIVVMLFGVFFIMGYIVGENSGPQGPEVASAKRPDVKPLVVDGPARAPEQTSAPQVAPTEPAESSESPAKPAPEPARAPEPVRTPAPAKAPAAAKEETRVSPATNQPVPGKPYLQLAAIDKDHADSMVDLLRKSGFQALDSEVPEKKGIYRVLVGPIGEGELGKTRADLQSKSFPGNAAIRKVF